MTSHPAHNQRTQPTKGALCLLCRAAGRARSVVMEYRNPHCLADSGNRGGTVRARPDARERERCVHLKRQQRDQLLQFQSGEGPSASSSSRSPPSPNQEKDEASITGRKLVRQNHRHHTFRSAGNGVLGHHLQVNRCRRASSGKYRRLESLQSFCTAR